MSNVFNIKRAANYFVHDLRAAKNNYLLQMVIFGCMPAIVFVFSQLFSMLFNGQGAHLDDGSVQIVTFIISIVCVIITFPVKQYGSLTEKRYGSDWLMLPASTFEKWLSMILVTCVALPAVFAVLFLGSDALLATIFPKLYPSAILSKDFLDFLTGLEAGLTDDLNIKIKATDISYINWCENILAFTLGAVIFKKAKFPKTMLAMMGVGIFVTMITMLCIGGTRMDGEELMNRFGDLSPQEIARKLNFFASALYTIVFVLLGGGLYLRLKTLKH